MHVLEFAPYLSGLRKKRGITQKQLADYLNVSVSAVSKWERGKCLPEITKLEEIAAFFEVPLSEVLECTEHSDKEETVESNTLAVRKGGGVPLWVVSAVTAAGILIVLSVFLIPRIVYAKEVKGRNIVTTIDGDPDDRAAHDYEMRIQDAIKEYADGLIYDVKPRIDIEENKITRAAVLIIQYDGSPLGNKEREEILEIASEITGIVKEEIQVVYDYE
ncbi:MAG: helix-turn-helix domain-containing protein [Lachnospiraceae bacterium]|nr:helix-turn-helix domain-containing protein [Lachnospiraceae bacterium]